MGSKMTTRLVPNKDINRQKFLELRSQFWDKSVPFNWLYQEVVTANQEVDRAGIAAAIRRYHQVFLEPLGLQDTGWRKTYEADLEHAKSSGTGAISGTARSITKYYQRMLWSDTHFAVDRYVIREFYQYATATAPGYIMYNSVRLSGDTAEAVTHPSITVPHSGTTGGPTQYPTNFMLSLLPTPTTPWWLQWFTPDGRSDGTTFSAGELVPKPDNAPFVLSAEGEVPRKYFTESFKTSLLAMKDIMLGLELRDA